MHIDFELNQDSLRKVDRKGMGGFAIESSSTLLNQVNEEYKPKERSYSPPMNYYLKEVIKVEKT